MCNPLANPVGFAFETYRYSDHLLVPSLPTRQPHAFHRISAIAFQLLSLLLPCTPRPQGQITSTSAQDPPELPSAHFPLGFIYSPSPLPQLQPSGPTAVALTLLASVFPGPGVSAPTYPQARSLASFRCHPFRGTFLDRHHLQLPSPLFPISWNTLLSLPAVFVPQHSAPPDAPHSLHLAAARFSRRECILLESEDSSLPGSYISI